MVIMIIIIIIITVQFIQCLSDKNRTPKTGWHNFVKIDPL